MRRRHKVGKQNASSNMDDRDRLQLIIILYYIKQKNEKESD